MSSLQVVGYAYDRIWATTMPISCSLCFSALAVHIWDPQTGLQSDPVPSIQCLHFVYFGSQYAEVFKASEMYISYNM